MQLKDAIKKRKSVRRFLDKKPDWRKILQAIDMARFAPLAGSQTSWKFILIDDKDKIDEIAEASQQDFVGKVSYIVAVVSDDTKLVRSYDEAGIKFGRQQAGAAIQNFLLALTELGLSTCWVGWFSEAQIKRVLRVPESCVVEAIFPVGLETKIKTPEKNRYDLDDVVYFNKWGNPRMEGKTRVSIESI